MKRRIRKMTLLWFRQYWGFLRICRTEKFQKLIIDRSFSVPPFQRTVRIPLTYPTPETAAVIEGMTGPDEAAKDSHIEGGDLVSAVNGSSTVKIVNNTRSFYDGGAASWFSNAAAWGPRMAS